jgi:hypothetical protein
VKISFGSCSSSLSVRVKKVVIGVLKKIILFFKIQLLMILLAIIALVSISAVRSTTTSSGDSDCSVDEITSSKLPLNNCALKEVPAEPFRRNLRKRNHEDQDSQDDDKAVLQEQKYPSESQDQVAGTDVCGICLNVPSNTTVIYHFNLYLS